MKKTHVHVTVRFQGHGKTPFPEMIQECDYAFASSPDTNADIVDHEIVEIADVNESGFTTPDFWFVTVDLLIHHNDDNIDEIIQEMDYNFTVNPDHDYTITDTEITNYTTTDSR